MTTWDVAVIGSGPAGSACACSALATSRRLRVALVDMKRFGDLRDLYTLWMLLGRFR